MHILAAKEDADTPKVTLVILYSASGLLESALQTNQCNSLSAGANSMARYILLMSAVMVMRQKRNLINTSMSGEWIVGPTSRRSFSDTPVADLAEASKTIRSLVVVLCSLRTACIGR